MRVEDSCIVVDGDIRLLVEARANIEAKDKNGMAPITYAKHYNTDLQEKKQTPETAQHTKISQSDNKFANRHRFLTQITQILQMNADFIKRHH